MTSSDTTIAAEAEETPVFGFWIYIMSDCILFAALFATYAVLHNNTFGGPSGRDIFTLPTVLVETLLLLTSSFTCGLGMLAAHRRNKNNVLLWFTVTLLLGLLFLTLEGMEFAHLASMGDSWQRSAFLSSYFTLVGTHGLHVALGSLWMLVLLIQVWFHDLTSRSTRRLMMLSLFWHFLDIVWIFIFTIVYLMGAL